MNLLRLLIVIALIWLAYRTVKRFLATTRRARTPRPAVTTDTVRCGRCGVYLPKSNAVSVHGKWYCEQHRPEDDE